jgi:hypothetical protein
MLFLYLCVLTPSSFTLLQLEIHRYQRGSTEQVTKVHQFNIICKRREDFLISVIIEPTSIQIGCRSTLETGFKEPNYTSDEPILLLEHHG